MSVLCQPLNGLPGMIEGLQLRFHSPTPGDLRSSSLTFPLWCPAKGCAGDVALLPSHDMSDPFPSSSHNDGTHIVLVTASKKFLVGDGLPSVYRPAIQQQPPPPLCIPVGYSAAAAPSPLYTGRLFMSSRPLPSVIWSAIQQQPPPILCIPVGCLTASAPSPLYIGRLFNSSRLLLCVPGGL